MQVEKSEELKYLLHVYAQETTFGDKKYDYCRLKLSKDFSNNKSRVLILQRDIETLTDLQ